MARNAVQNNAFYSGALGLRRVKKTVNFDEPSVYHLYYGDEHGTPGTIMTHFPFPQIGDGRPGTGEVGRTVFSVPEGALAFWRPRLAAAGATEIEAAESFGQKRLNFRAPEGDGLALVEVVDDKRLPWTGNGVAADEAIRGFHSASLRLKDGGATEGLLRYMGYTEAETHKGIKRLTLPGGNGADFVDIETLPNVDRAVGLAPARCITLPLR